ncbi:MAG: phosphatase PAP2 family protein [Bacteroidetes bacterium]|nr:phosphatase PAP2 family protein [Bacteroidota bacterium]
MRPKLKFKNFIKSGLLPGFFLCTQFVYTQSYWSVKVGRDLPLMAGSGLVFGTGMYFQSLVKPYSAVDLSNLKTSQVPKFDRIACSQWDLNAGYASDGLAISSVLLPLYFLTNKQSKSGFYPIANVSLQSLALSQAIAGITKLSKRDRPFLYNPEVPISEKLKQDARLSFFSAHTVTVSSTCFSFALAHKTYLPNSKANPYISAGAFLIPALEGYLRVKAGKHFPSDVIVGYLVGMGSAYLMHRLYLKTN